MKTVQSVLAVWRIGIRETRGDTSGPAGHKLMVRVEGRLILGGQKRSDRKAVKNVIHDIREQDLARYGGWSEQTLRDAYYQVRKRLSQSRKSDE
jgi:hypothetical protein